MAILHCKSRAKSLRREGIFRLISSTNLYLDANRFALLLVRSYARCRQERYEQSETAAGNWCTNVGLNLARPYGAQ